MDDDDNSRGVFDQHDVDVIAGGAQEQVVPDDATMTSELSEYSLLHEPSHQMASTPSRHDSSRIGRQQRMSDDSGYQSSPNVNSPRDALNYSETVLNADVFAQTPPSSQLRSPALNRAHTIPDIIEESDEEDTVQFGLDPDPDSADEQAHRPSPSHRVTSSLNTSRFGGSLLSASGGGGGATAMDCHVTPHRSSPMSSRHSEPAISTMAGARPKTNISQHHRAYSPNHFASLCSGDALHAVGTPPRLNGFMALSHGRLDLHTAGISQDTPAPAATLASSDVTMQQRHVPHTGKFNL